VRVRVRVRAAFLDAVPRAAVERLLVVVIPRNFDADPS
jgi:hypothetical protein